MIAPDVSPTSLQTLSKIARLKMRQPQRADFSWEVMWWGLAAALAAFLAAMAGIIVQGELGPNLLSTGLGGISGLSGLLGAGLAVVGFFLPLWSMLKLLVSGQDPLAARADTQRTALLGWASVLSGRHDFVEMEAAGRSAVSEIARIERRKSIQILLAALTAAIAVLAKAAGFDAEPWGKILVFVSSGLSAGAALGVLVMFGYLERLHIIREAVDEAAKRLQVAISPGKSSRSEQT